MSEGKAPPIETHHLADIDAAEWNDQIGGLVVEIYGSPPYQVQAMPAEPYADARRHAAVLSDRHPDRVFAFYKLSAVMGAVTAVPAAPGEVPA